MLTLSKDAKMSSRDTLEYTKNNRRFLFHVLGLPEGRRAEIRESARGWDFRLMDGACGGWSVRYGSSEEALTAIDAGIKP